MFYTSSLQWAQEVFGQADLGDIRRTKRLIKIAANSAKRLGRSLVKSCNNSAEIEAAYRFIRNDAISSEDIDSAGFEVTAKHAEQYELLLALEDSTSLNFSHASVRDELGHITASKRARGMLAHSVLLYAPKEQYMVGLIEQNRWSRDITTYGQSAKVANKTPYKEKESFKWEAASRKMAERLTESTLANVLSICDREADIFEYLTYKTEHKQRFVVRSRKSRHIEEAVAKLHEYGHALQCAGSRELLVEQKGGRKARKAKMEVKFTPVNLIAPANKKGPSLPLYYVMCNEIEGDACWHLLTSEKIDTQEEAQKIVDYYESRWLIEDYHKAWKSGGTHIEELRMQNKQNLEKMSVILAFIAVRIMQLRLLGRKSNPKSTESCESLLSTVEWKMLWLKRENKKLPKTPPSIHWAYINIAKLAGWYDSKRTGIVGWKTLWEGWFLLETILEGYYVAKSLEEM